MKSSLLAILVLTSLGAIAMATDLNLNRVAQELVVRTKSDLANGKISKPQSDKIFDQLDQIKSSVAAKHVTAMQTNAMVETMDKIRKMLDDAEGGKASNQTPAANSDWPFASPSPQ